MGEPSRNLYPKRCVTPFIGLLRKAFSLQDIFFKKEALTILNFKIIKNIQEPPPHTGIQKRAPRGREKAGPARENIFPDRT